ncbi:MAG: hypothetical protein OHK0021_10150 [Bryobacter sp.]
MRSWFSLSWAARLLAALLFLGFLLSRPELLRALGNYLVLSEPPRKADLAFVLGGDFEGHRILKACEVAQAGYAPRIWVSGPGTVFDEREANLAIRFATEKGCPSTLLQPFLTNANSTLDEANIFRERVRQAGYRSCLLVTSNFHTRRAARLFRQQVPEVEFTVIASPDPAFDADHWWETRPQRKVFTYEWIKTVTSWVGI